MANRAAVEAVDILLRQLKDCQLPFGGVLLLGIGDFRQVAPVVRGCNKAGVLDSSIRASALWHHFEVLRLHAPVRNNEDPEFATWVDEIGENANGKDSIDVSQQPHCANIADAAAWLYPDDVLANPRTCAKRAFLTTLNADVDQFNESILSRLTGQSSKYSCPTNSGMY